MLYIFRICVEVVGQTGVLQVIVNFTFFLSFSFLSCCDK